MVTFVEGAMAKNTLENWGRLGAMLGQLHSLDVAGAMAVTPPVQGSRFQPGGAISDLLERLRAIAGQVPAELQTLYDVCVDICHRVDRWRHGPTAILHTDCWLNNAIQTPQGELVMVDWDGAGLGPAVLDIGYLLVACHCYLPEWPRLAPNADYIGAVVEGYCQRRKLTPAEVELLPDAVRLSIIYHDARDFSQMLHDERLKNRNLERFHVRYPAAEEIAYLGRACFEI
jgi:Ser/Thr protein kinase RdoA (MazF antagonist)